MITVKNLFNFVLISLVIFIAAVTIGCNSGDPYDDPNPSGLSIVKISPIENQQNVAVNTAVQVTFEKDIDVNSLSSSTFILSKRRSGTTANGKIEYDAGTKTASLKPYTSLVEGEVYETVVSGVKGKNGEFVPPHAFRFTTSKQLLVERVGPLNNARAVKVSGSGRQDILAVFNDSIDYENIDVQSDFFAYEQSKYTGALASQLDASIQYDDTVKTLYLNPKRGRLKYSHKYYVTLRNIKSKTNSILNEMRWEFETDDARVSAISPSNESSNVTTNTQIAIYLPYPVDKNTVAGNIKLRKKYGAQELYVFPDAPAYENGDTKIVFTTQLSAADSGLEFNTTYQLDVDGVSTAEGEVFKPTTIFFKTAAEN